MAFTPATRLAGMLRVAREYKASDIHLMAGLPPAYRVSGEIVVADWEPFTRDELCALTSHILTPAQHRRLDEERELCISYYYEDLGRIRVSFYHRLGVPEIAVRMCNLEIKSAGELMLPPVVEPLAMKKSGLVVITGPTGMGKTTTLNYMIDVINRARRCKIITIEDPVEFEHHHRNSIIAQIEVTTDTLSFSSCLRHVLRLDPDVICIGEMRDVETMETALTAAETGHLVIATLHTPNAVGTVERIVGCFEGARQNQVILQLSSVIEGIIAQRLVPTVDRKRRVLACEIMLATTAVRNLIREKNLHQLQNAITTSRGIGMQTMEDALARLYREGLITRHQALINANQPDALDAMLSK